MPDESVILDPYDTTKWRKNPDEIMICAIEAYKSGLIDQAAVNKEVYEFNQRYKNRKLK